MVWKWKHNRLGDSVPLARPQSGIQGGVSNPTFLGPMVHHKNFKRFIQPKNQVFIAFYTVSSLTCILH